MTFPTRVVLTWIPDIDKECVCKEDVYEMYKCAAAKLEKIIRELLKEEKTKSLIFCSRAPNDDYSCTLWAFEDDKVVYRHFGYATARGYYSETREAKTLAEFRWRRPEHALHELATWVRYKLNIKPVLTEC